MRRIALLAVLIGASFMIAAPQAHADVSIGVSVNYFHDALSPYGDWVRSDRFGVVWAPRRVSHGWRPYYYGHWVYTDYDWTWVSDDDWGWATDHYGRWYFEPRLGWVWIPGQEWGPAWVAWRYGDGYVGWAPLPPDVDPYRRSFVDVRIDPFAFCFVEQRRVFEPAVYRHAVPVARNVTIVNVTQNITNYTYVNNHVVNRGMDVRNVEHSLGHAVPRVQVREATSISEARGASVKGGAVAVFRPRVEQNAKAPVREVKASRNERDDKLEDAAKHEAKERERLQFAEERERKDLHKIQERDNKQPVVLSTRRDARDDETRAVSNKAEREKAERAKAEHEKADRETHERAQLAQQQELRQRHDAELREQAEHEQRERQVLNERQDREREARDRQRQAMERDQRDNQPRPETRQAEGRSKGQQQQLVLEGRPTPDPKATPKPNPKPTPKKKHEGQH